MKAEIIVIGEEILSGQSIDSNSAFIARKLAEIGIEVYQKSTVGDRHDQIKEAVKAAWNRSPITICTGGLGPTRDDVTKQAICAAFDRKLVLNEGVLHQLEEFYRSRGRKMPASVQSQALQPQGAELLTNRLGTAPGIVFQDAEHYFAAIPGVPAEMEAMVQESIIPYLARREGREYIAIRRIRTVGIFESQIADLISDLEPTTSQLRLAYLPSYRGVDLRVTASSATPEEAESQANKLSGAIVSRLQEYVFTIGEESLPEVVGRMLKERGETLAVAESCTGGLIGKILTDTPGSSEYFLGSVVSYADSVKEGTLRVPKQLLIEHGAVSREVAEAMATGIRQITGSDYALSVTGIAGPGGGSELKPVGLVFIGIGDRESVIARRFQFHGTRDRIRETSAYTALELLWRRLLAARRESTPGNER